MNQVILVKSCFILEVCGPGKEYNIETKSCDMCGAGSLKASTSSRDRCISCPMNSNSEEGAESCYSMFISDCLCEHNHMCYIHLCAINQFLGQPISQVN